MRTILQRSRRAMTLIESQAKVLDANVNARTRRIIPALEPDSVFRSQTRPACAPEWWQRRQSCVGSIVGCRRYRRLTFSTSGGRLPVREIHPFDGDNFKQHNAFRAGCCDS